MCTDVVATIALFYPNIEKVESAVVNQAISLAQSHAPACLPEAKQALAVAYYAAYLLAQRAESGVNPLGLASEREGDLAVTYSLELRKSTQFLAKYQELNAICQRLGAMTVGLNYGGV